MEKKKLSIGIDVDPSLKKAITKSIKPCKDLPVRWHKPESYHIPLVGLGWVEERVMMDVLTTLHAFCLQQQGIDVTLEKIDFFFHTKDATTPQYIRVFGRESIALRDLYRSLLDALAIGHGNIKTFTPYISLGHVRAQKWREQQITQQCMQEFHVIVDVMALTLFEEISIDGRRTITPVETFPLQ